MSKRQLLLLILLLISIVISLGIIFFPSDTSHLTKQQRISQLEQIIRCPVCGNEPIANSSEPIALDLKSEVISMVNQGKSNQQIINWLESKYGSSIILTSNPANLDQDIIVIAIISAAGLLTAFILHTHLKKFPNTLHIKAFLGKHYRLIIGITGLLITTISSFYLIALALHPALVTSETSTNNNAVIKTDLSLAQHLALDGQSSLAIYVYAQVLKIDPKNVTALAEQGYLISQSGVVNHSGALIKKGFNEIQNALSLNPNYAQAYLYSGTIELTSFNNASAAVKDFAKFLKLNPNTELLKESKPIIELAYKDAHIKIPDKLN
jgi:cytochrome c-type biogenesis protein CcmH/NrfF